MVQAPEELRELLADLLGPEGGEAFLGVVGQGGPTAFRVNTLKTTDHRAFELLEEEGFRAEPLRGVPHGYLLTEEPFPLGRSFSHFLGNLYIQDPSSMLPPLALRPAPGELVLDLAAAPGSKTTQMAAMVENRGLIVANDPKVRRSTFLSFNLMRTGAVNAVVTLLPGNRLGRLYFETFDRVLLDPPCSALGTVKAAPEALRWWRRAERLSRLQWDLMVSAIKALKPGGVLVYSTCTLMPQENEAVVAEALRRYPVELEKVKFEGLKAHPGLTSFQDLSFPQEMSRAVRLYPHEGPGEGFFIARLRKTSGMRAKELRIFTPEAARLSYLNYTHRGLPLARPEGPPPALTTWGAQFLGLFASQNVIDLQDPMELLSYLRREELAVSDGLRGQQVIRYRGHPVGYGVAANGRLKSRARLRKEVLWPLRLQGQA